MDKIELTVPKTSFRARECLLMIKRVFDRQAYGVRQDAQAHPKSVHVESFKSEAVLFEALADSARIVEASDE